MSSLYRMGRAMVMEEEVFVLSSIRSIRGKFCRMIDCQAVRSIFNSAAWEIKVAVTLELCGAKVIDCTLGFFRIIHTRQNDTQQSLRLSLFHITKSCCKQTCIPITDIYWSKMLLPIILSDQIKRCSILKKRSSKKFPNLRRSLWLVHFLIQMIR